MANDIAPLPSYYRRLVQSELKTLLEKVCKDFKLEQAFVGYVEPNDLVWIDPELWFGRPNFPARVLTTNEGLCGLAIRENKVYVYPDDAEARDKIVLLDKIQTESEIAGPLRYRNRVCGVVLLHSSDSKTVFSKASSKATFTKSLEKMNAEIRRVEEVRDITKRHLKRIAEDCREKLDKAHRGYIAVKDWDGGLEYFYASETTEGFLALDQWEGLCGEVMATGVPIYARNVLEHPAYTPSDPDIHSEIVYPIRDGEETIGVVNMESKDHDAFDDAEEVMQKTAREAGEDAKTFRQPPSDAFGYVLGDYIGSVAGLLEFESHKSIESADDVEEQIVHLLRAKAQKALAGMRSMWWPQVARPPFASARKQAADAQNVLIGGFGNDQDLYTIYAQVTVSGMPHGTIGIEKLKYAAEDPHILETFCRVTAFFLQHWNREKSLRTSVLLLQRLTRHTSGSIVEETVHRVPAIFGGESCTLFYKTTILGREVFVPGPTTLQQVARAAVQDGNPWYESDPREGLTAWVGSKGRSVRIRDIRDKAELSAIDVDLTWKKWLAEAGESRSFLACPIFRPGERETPEHVIGVLRTHRALDSRESGFSEDDLLILQAIARLIAIPLNGIISQPRLVT